MFHIREKDMVYIFIIYTAKQKYRQKYMNVEREFLSFFIAISRCITL